MMLELESLSTFSTFEFSQIWSVVVISHMSVKFCDVGKLLGANATGLRRDNGIFHFMMSK